MRFEHCDWLSTEGSFKIQTSLRQYLDLGKIAFLLQIYMLPCGLCTKEFKHYSSLSRHRKMHSSSRVYLQQLTGSSLGDTFIDGAAPTIPSLTAEPAGQDPCLGNNIAGAEAWILPKTTPISPVKIDEAHPSQMLPILTGILDTINKNHRQVLSQISILNQELSKRIDDASTLHQRHTSFLYSSVTQELQELRRTVGECKPASIPEDFLADLHNLNTRAAAIFARK